jgi:hypothetical protein
MDFKNCILANTFVKHVPLGVAIVCGVILLIAFLIGLKKGARRVGWGGLVWVLAGVAFFVTDKFLGDKNPLFKLLDGKMDDGAVAFVCATSIALVCALLALALQGIFSLIFRPRKVWKKKKDDLYTTDEYGIEYDDDYKDYDDYDDFRKRKVLVKKGYRTPSVFGRILGGLLCMINALVVLAVIVSSALLVVDCTSLKTGAMSVIYENKAVVWSLKYVRKYVLDFVIVGILIGLAGVGRKKGFLETLRSLIVFFGGFALVGVCFWLPFSPLSMEGENKFLFTIVDRCSAFIEKLGAKALLADVISKILAGILLTAIAVIALALINALLKALIRGVESVGFLRVTDGAISVVLYLIIGVAVVIAVGAILYTLYYFDLFRVGGLITGDGISGGLFKACDTYLQPWLEKGMESIKGLLENLSF